MLMATSTNGAAVPQPDPNREAEELKQTEEQRHVELPHRTGVEKHEDAYRGGEGDPRRQEKPDGAATEEDVPLQDGRGARVDDRPTAEGADRRDAPPDRS